MRANRVVAVLMVLLPHRADDDVDDAVLLSQPERLLPALGDAAEELYAPLSHPLVHVGVAFAVGLEGGQDHAHGVLGLKKKIVSEFKANSG